MSFPNFPIHLKDKYVYFDNVVVIDAISNKPDGTFYVSFELNGERLTVPTHDLVHLPKTTD